jgi:hypothetical protein
MKRRMGLGCIGSGSSCEGGGKPVRRRHGGGPIIRSFIAYQHPNILVDIDEAIDG